MSTNSTPSPDASSADAAVFPATRSGNVSPYRSGDPEPDVPRERIGWIEGHMPDIVDPLIPADPDTAFTETRRMRHDGWTPARKRLFLERFAECGIIVEACEAAGMSARAAYNLRDRDALFAAGWDAAGVKARAPLADEAYSRAVNGVVERIYKDGVVVAERHRYDNRLTMSVLARLDARIDRAEEKGAAHLTVAARWDEYLDALGEGREEDGRALLVPPSRPPAAGPAADARHRELHELRGRGHADDAADYDPEYEDDGDLGDEFEDEDGDEEDNHILWQSGGTWWTDYPPPADYDGNEFGEYGDSTYRRTLTEAETAVVEAEEGSSASADLARAQAQRAARFGSAEEPLCLDP